MDISYPLQCTIFEKWQYFGVLKTTLKAVVGRTFMHWDKRLAQATWLVSTLGSVSRDGPAQSSLLCTEQRDGVHVVHKKNL